MYPLFKNLDRVRNTARLYFAIKCALVQDRVEYMAECCPLVLYSVLRGKPGRGQHGKCCLLRFQSWSSAQNMAFYFAAKMPCIGNNIIYQGDSHLNHAWILWKYELVVYEMQFTSMKYMYAEQVWFMHLKFDFDRSCLWICLKDIQVVVFSIGHQCDYVCLYIFPVMYL